LLQDWRKVDVARIIENLSDKDITNLKAIISDVRSDVAPVYKITRQGFAGVSDEALDNEFQREVERLVRIGWGIHHRADQRYQID